MNGLFERFTTAIVLISCIGGATPARAAAKPDSSLPTWQGGVRGDLAFETSDFLATTAYRKPDSTLEQMNPDGAHGPVNQAWDRTHRGFWLIEEQRYGFDSVVAGLLYHRQDLIDHGRKIFDWGFAQQQPDGGFECPDRFHSASFFIEAAAHAALLLQASDMAAQNLSWVNSVKPKLRLVAEWMINPLNEEPGRKHDEPYTHRFYLDADAIGETGVLTGDENLVKHSRRYVQAGLERQQPDGANPEKGGTDTSYHVVGLLYALDYYTLVANNDLRSQMQPMITNGLNWLGARIRSDGTVNQTGNTRTGFGQERGPQGNLKTMSYGSAYRAYFYWAMITHDPRWAGVATQLFKGQQVEKDERKAGNFHL